jgi:hypothetical protein
MLDNLPDPGNGVSWWSILLALLLSAWGGAVSYLHRVARGKLRCSLREFAVEIFTSLFAGMIVYAIAHAFGFNPLLGGALAGLGGHAGTRTIFLLQHFFIRNMDGK